MTRYNLTYTETRQVNVIPESCNKCPFWESGVCYKPLSRARGEERVKKAYLTKRHKDCPLTWEEI